MGSDGRELGGSGKGLARGFGEDLNERTHLFVAAEHNKATAARFSSFWRTQSPECDRPAAVLREPAFQFALGSVMWKTAEVQHLGALAEERTHITPGIERARHDIWIAWMCLRCA